jgi:hypothetical protein
MTKAPINESKDNCFKLSDQVKATLHQKGYSFLFNYEDFKIYKKKAKNAFNKAYTIAELFIKENQPQKSDYSEYLF